MGWFSARFAAARGVSGFPVPGALAQSALGSISGNVVDASGAAPRAPR